MVNKNNKKIVFILPSLSHPRFIKRVVSLYKAGFDIEVYGFDRNIYSINKIPEYIKVNVIGNVVDGKNYLKRISLYNKKLYQIFKKYREKQVIYYVFGHDLAIITSIFGRKPYIYEIGDLRYVYFNRFFELFFLFFDRKVISKSIMTVLITEGFMEYLNVNMNKNKIIIQPNKISTYFNNFKRNPLCNNNEKIVFSFVGLIRYPNTIFRFAKIVGEYFPMHEFRFYGDTPMFRNEIIDLTNKYPNVKFIGEFKNPEDMETIYQNIDCVVMCYDVTNINEKVAQPNKFYEAIFFCKPIIISEKMLLAKEVQHNKWGFAIDATNEKEIKKLISSINKKELVQISINLSKVPNNKIIDDDAKKIIEELNSILE
jgi:glycosyltransferase involved in cell wall biosynthesis